MSADILELYQSGSPGMLLKNAAQLADDMEFMLMVFVTKDGTIRSEWSTLPSNLQGLGAIEMLRSALMSEEN